MDLKSYLRQHKGDPEARPSATAPSAEAPEDLKKQAEELSKKSHSELMTQLMSEVQKGRTDGTFSADALNAFAEKLSPMLNAEQQERLQALKSQLDQQI